MKKFAAVALVTAALAAAPLAPAHAEWHHGGRGFGPGYRHGDYREFHHRHHRGPGAWPLVGVIAGVTGAALLASSFNDAPPPPRTQVYVAPAPVVYAPQPVVQRTVVYPAQSYTTTYYGY